MTDLYAHTPNEKGEWHRLDKLLHDVAEMAQDFADKFSAGNLAYWLETWHVLEKSNASLKKRNMSNV